MPCHPLILKRPFFVSIFLSELKANLRGFRRWLALTGDGSQQKCLPNGTAQGEKIVKAL